MARRRTARPLYWTPPRRGLGSTRAAAEALEACRGLPTATQADTLPLFRALRVSAWHARKGDDGWAARWAAIRSRLAELHMGLAVEFARRSQPDRPADDEFLSVAQFALLRAIDGFDPWRGFQFSTYACNIIARAVRREIGQAARRRTGPSYDSALDRPERHEMADDLAALRAIRHRMADILNARELEVIKSRWLTKASRPVPLRTIGKKLGITKKRVRQLGMGAMVKLRRAITAQMALTN